MASLDSAKVHPQQAVTTKTEMKKRTESEDEDEVQENLRWGIYMIKKIQAAKCNVWDW